MTWNFLSVSWKLSLFALIWHFPCNFTSDPSFFLELHGKKLRCNNWYNLKQSMGDGKKIMNKINSNSWRKLRKIETTKSFCGKRFKKYMKNAANFSLSFCRILFTILWHLAKEKNFKFFYLLPVTPCKQTTTLQPMRLSHTI